MVTTMIVYQEYTTQVVSCQDPKTEFFPDLGKRPGTVT